MAVYWCVLPDIFYPCVISIFILKPSQTYSKGTSTQHRFFISLNHWRVASQIPHDPEFLNVHFLLWGILPHNQVATIKIRVTSDALLPSNSQTPNFSSCPNNIFITEGSTPELRVVFSCPICVVSFSLEQFFSLSLIFDYVATIKHYRSVAL